MNIYQTANQMKIQHQTIYDLNITVTYYVRVSTLKEEQMSSVDNQVAHFEKLIKEHPNWSFNYGYIDKVRGESAANRENFMRMIEDGKAGKFDLILTKEVSRFARNTIDSLTYTRDLLRCGVGVLFENDNICTIDTDAEFRLTIMSSIAQDEVRKLSERVKFGHKQSIQKGVVMGNSRIYGYDKNKGTLVINEKEAEMVRLIFNMYSSGRYALRAIERELYNRGYRSRNGNKINHNTIGAIINNPKYKGYYCGNKVKIADYRTKEQIFLPEEEWIMYKDETQKIVPAIVDENTWNLAHQLFTQRSNEVKNLVRGNKTTSVLSGKLYCTHHSAPLWRTSYSSPKNKNQIKYQWICREKKRGKSSDCPTFPIYENELYNLIKTFFLSIIDNIDEYTQAFIEEYKESDDIKQINDKAINCQHQLKKMSIKKEKLFELYLDNAVSKADFQFYSENINTEIDTIQKELSCLTNTKHQHSYLSQNITIVKKEIESLLNIDTLTKEDIDNFISLAIYRIEVTSIDKNTMSVNFIMNDKNIQNSTEYSHSNSGQICKKMIDAYKQGIKS